MICNSLLHFVTATNSTSNKPHKVSPYLKRSYLVNTGMCKYYPPGLPISQGCAYTCPGAQLGGASYEDRCSPCQSMAIASRVGAKAGWQRLIEAVQNFKVEAMIFNTFTSEAVTFTFITPFKWICAYHYFSFFIFLSLFSHLHRIKAIHIHHIHPPLYVYVIMSLVLNCSTTRKNDNKQHNLPWAPDPAMLGVFILEALQI